MSTSKKKEEEEKKNKMMKKKEREKNGNDWYGFGIQVIRNLIYTILFGLIGANFIFYYKVLNFETYDEKNDEEEVDPYRMEDKYFPIKTSDYNKDFFESKINGVDPEPVVDEDEDYAEDDSEEYEDANIEENNTNDQDKGEENKNENGANENGANENSANENGATEESKSEESKNEGNVKNEVNIREGIEKRDSDDINKNNSKYSNLDVENKENIKKDDGQGNKKLLKDIDNSDSEKFNVHNENEDSKGINEEAMKSKDMRSDGTQSKDIQSEEQKKKNLESARNNIPILTKSEVGKKRVPEKDILGLKRGGVEYKCGSNKADTSDDKTNKSSGPVFPYNLFNYKELESCTENSCKIPFSSWWKNNLAYSVFKTNRTMRNFIRSWFKNDKKFGILQSDTSFYLLCIIYFIIGLAFSFFSGIIYLATTLFLDRNKATTKKGDWIELGSGSWVIFNFLLFGIMFAIITIFAFVNIFQYVINFTIKPLMNDPEDIKNILKCNVHTLILFFCYLTINSSSEYLDDTSTSVMTFVTILYFIRTVIIYLRG